MNTAAQRRGAFFLALVLAASPLTPALAAGPEPITAHATYWQESVKVEGEDTYLLVDGEKLNFINLNGNVYVPLVIGAQWSKAAASLQWGADNINFLYDYFQPRVPYTSSDLPVKTQKELEEELSKPEYTEGFEVTVLPHLTMSIQGEPLHTTNAQGIPLYPISYQGVTYIPIRTVAQVGGFGFWLREVKYPIKSAFTLYLFLPPSRAQLTAGMEYADLLEAYAKDLEQDIVQLETSYNAHNITHEQLKDKLSDIRSRLLRARDLSIPSASTLTQIVLRLNATLEFRISEILDANIAINELPSGATVRGVRSVAANHLRTGVLLEMDHTVELIRALCGGMAESMPS